MKNFKDYITLDDAAIGYVLSSVMTEVSNFLNEDPIEEGRADRYKLANSDFSGGTSTLFGDDNPEDKIDKWRKEAGGPNAGTVGRLGGETCERTPLSGYASHIETIQKFARSSPQNFAQVLMFSPLSANVPFAKHWDNYYTLMLILKHQFPQQVSRQEIEHAVDSFGDKYHNLKHTIQSFKLDTISDIWSNKENLFHELNTLAAGQDDVALIKRLSMIQGVQPVKAGFIVQLLWGRAGCIDTHNIDIYSKVFPDMEKSGDFDTTKWDSKKKGGVEKYVGVLDKLQKRGIGTKQLWDVWVDFVESFYIMITQHGRGYYDMQGGALDPSAPEYGDMKDVKIPKMGIGRDRGGVMVPLAKGKVGMGASATHLPIEPDEALKQFHQIYNKGDKGSDAARAVAFHKDALGRPLDQNLGSKPTALHYFSPAVGDNGHIDPDHIRQIIRNRMAKGGTKALRRRNATSQGQLF